MTDGPPPRTDHPPDLSPYVRPPALSSGQNPHNGSPPFRAANANLFFETAVARNPQQTSFLAYIRSIIEELSPNPDPGDFIDALIQEMPPFQLFSPHVLRDTVYYRRLIEYMDSIGVKIAEHQPGRRKLYARRLADTIYTTPDDARARDIAYNLCDAYLHWDPTDPDSPRFEMDPTAPRPFNSPTRNSNDTAGQVNVTIPSHKNDSSYSVHHQVRGNYKTPECKYSGEDVDESWQAICLQYESDATIYSLTDEQQLELAPVILRGDALQYYDEHVKGQVTTYTEFKQKISERFNNRAMQERVKTYLQGLRFNQFTRDGRSPNDALILLVSAIKRNYAKTPQSWQCEDNKMGILEDAVCQQPWSRSPVDRLHSEIRTFEGFYAALSNSLQKYVKESSSQVTQPNQSHEIFFQQPRYASRSNGFIPRSSGFSQNQPTPSHYGNRHERRPFYSSNNSHRPTFRPNRYHQQARNFSNAKEVFQPTPGASCFNCGQQGHMWQRCRSPKDFKRIGTGMANFFENKNAGMGTKRVLYQFAEALNILFVDPTADAEDTQQQLEEETQIMFQGCDAEEEVVHGDAMEEREMNNILAVQPTNQMDSMEIEAHEHMLMEDNLGALSMEEGANDADPSILYFNTPTQLSAQYPEGQNINKVQVSYKNDCNIRVCDAKEVPDAITCLPDSISTVLLTGKTSEFLGACLDTGASTCVIGLSQAQKLSMITGQNIGTRRMGRVFKFGKGTLASIGTIHIRIPTPKDTFVPITVDIVSSDIPFLLGLDLMTKLGLVIDLHRDTVSHPMGEWKMPLKRHSGHLFIVWPNETIQFTRTELHRMHLNFFHPSSSKLYNLIRRARPKDVTKETRRMLEEISKSCKICATHQIRGLRFKVSLPDENLAFNQSLAMDLMYIDGKPILHVVDIATGFGNAAVLTGSSVEDVWTTFVNIWATVYPGYPNKLKVDSGSVFTSPRWTRCSESAGISLQVSGIESHNSLGLGERYHAPLRRIFYKIRSECPAANFHVSLRLAVKAMNDTMGPSGLVPSYLVFGILPRYPLLNTTLPLQSERMQILKTAKSEMATIVSEMRIKQALMTRPPAAASVVHQPGDMVRIYREGDKKLIGPFRVVKVDEKEVYIDQDGRLTHFNITQAIPVPSVLNDENDRSMSAINDALSVFRNPHHMTKDAHDSKPSGSNSNATPAPQIEYNGPMTRSRTADLPKIMVTDTLHPTDPRCRLPDFADAKQQEIEGLIRKGTWKYVRRDEVPADANILGSRFVLAIKNAETKNPTYKARLVVQGHRDKEKSSLVHESINMRQPSIKIVTAIAAVCEFQLWSTDVSQAYLQSGAPLQRNVYLRPTTDFSLPPGTLLKLIRPLYGLSDAGDYWHATFSHHMLKDLGMRRTFGDLALFYKYVDDRLIGLAGTYVDDSLLAGTSEFKMLNKATTNKFISRSEVKAHFVFSGIEITDASGVITLQQSKQTQRISYLAPNATYKMFRSALAKLAWLCHTRPDISCAVAQLAQCSEPIFRQAHAQLLNSAIRTARASPRMGIVHKKLERDTLRIVTYTDGAFANNADGSSQLGYVTVMADANGKCNILHYRSFKSRRVTRSVLGAEVMAFAEGFDSAFVLKRDLQRVLNQQVPLTMLTDSRSLFDVITKNSTTAERRLMIDIAAAREAYGKLEISNIGLVRSEFNAADAMTKAKKCPALIEIVENGILQHPIAEWVLRRDVTHRELVRRECHAVKDERQTDEGKKADGKD